MCVRNSLRDGLQYRHLQHLEECTVSRSQKSTKEGLNYSPHSKITIFSIVKIVNMSSFSDNRYFNVHLLLVGYRFCCVDLPAWQIEINTIKTKKLSCLHSGKDFRFVSDSDPWQTLEITSVYICPPLGRCGMTFLPYSIQCLDNI